LKQKAARSIIASERFVLCQSSPRSRLSSRAGRWSEVRQVHWLGYSLFFSAGCYRHARSDQWHCSRISIQPGPQDFSSVRQW